MSLIKKSTNYFDSNYLSSRVKVIHYLQNSTNSLANNCLTISSTKEFLPNAQRLRSSSEDESISSSSSSSLIDSLSRSDVSVKSSLSDPVAQGSSCFSSEEELDFNLGFDRMNDEDFSDQEFLDNANSDTMTLLDEGIHEFERQLSNLTLFDNNDETILNQHKLCAQMKFLDFEQDNTLKTDPTSFDDLQLNKPTSKKGVRFADMLGLDLESIRYMTPPEYFTPPLFQERIRHQIGRLLNTKDETSHEDVQHRSISSKYYLISKNFTSPTNIISLIYEKPVLLECLYTKDSIAYGTIRVHNRAFEKHVFVRLTQDEWITWNDIQAHHSINYPYDNTDVFSFEITFVKPNDETQRPKRILFAICLQAMQQDFWDNNHGWNYVLDVAERR